MGISISCRKTGTSYDMSYIGFFRLRNKVAALCSPEFGELYARIHNAPYFAEARQAFFEEVERKTRKLIAEEKVGEKIVDFCLQSDCEGSIRYGAVKEIYEAVKDYDDDIAYGYAAHSDCFTFSKFKELLLECIQNRCGLKWD